MKVGEILSTMPRSEPIVLVPATSPDSAALERVASGLERTFSNVELFVRLAERTDHYIPFRHRSNNRRSLRVLLADQCPCDSRGDFADGATNSFGPFGRWLRLRGSTKEDEFMACLDVLMGTSSQQQLGQSPLERLNQTVSQDAATAFDTRLVQEAALAIVRDAMRDCGVDPELGERLIEDEDWEPPTDMLEGLPPGLSMAHALGWYNDKLQAMMAAMAVAFDGGFHAGSRMQIWIDNLEKDPPGGLLMSKVLELVKQQLPGRRLQKLMSVASLTQLVDGIGQGRAIFSLKEERGEIMLCIGPEQAVADDAVVIAGGARAPLILRQDWAHGCYRFVGECYVDGIMDGEFVGGHVDCKLKKTYRTG